ncbi:hypothetical protein FRC05_006844, partial [Tulasnella sp. 425]
MDYGEQIVFEGRDGTEAENFIRNVKSRAFKLDKQRDNEWMAAFASICFAGNALRWFESLDDETQSDWKLLRSAILAKYPAGSVDGGPSPLQPSVSTSSSSQSRGGPSSISTTSSSPPPRLGSWTTLPPTTAPNGPRTSSHHRTTSRSSSTPLPGAIDAPAAGPPPVNSGPAVPAFIAARLTQRARDSLNIPKIRGRIRVIRNNSSMSEYVSRGVTTSHSWTGCRGYHFVAPSASNALEVEYSASSKPHRLRILNPTTDRGLLALTWFEKSPRHLGSQQGELSYVHLADASRDGNVEAETSFEWNGRLLETDDEDQLSNDTGAEVWRVGVDGTVHTSWTVPSGKIYSLWPIVSEIDDEILFVVDYDMFLAAHDGQGYSRA